MGRVLIMAHRTPAGGETEAEPILVSAKAGLVTLELDDGDRLVLPIGELLDVLADAEL